MSRKKLAIKHDTLHKERSEKMKTLIALSLTAMLTGFSKKMEQK